jgi:hypothetical protein
MQESGDKARGRNFRPERFIGQDNVYQRWPRSHERAGTHGIEQQVMSLAFSDSQLYMGACMIVAFDMLLRRKPLWDACRAKQQQKIPRPRYAKSVHATAGTGWCEYSLLVQKWADDFQQPGDFMEQRQPGGILTILVEPSWTTPWGTAITAMVCKRKSC